ncbi:MAG: ribosomal protein S18-alanine N-acetyltransferase [Pseudomonadota bacterium]
MSAQLQFEAPALRRAPMTVADLDAVLTIEKQAYEFPWTRGNFIDSLAAGYRAELLRHADGDLCAYCVAMAGVQEMHLLNLSVAPDWQHRGLARGLLDALVADSRSVGALWVWLEVRESNHRAREVYRRYGFDQIAWRRGYYPAAAGRREDACVMRLSLSGDRDALE